jgi:hypothetical protein
MAAGDTFELEVFDDELGRYVRVPDPSAKPLSVRKQNPKATQKRRFEAKQAERRRANEAATANINELGSGIASIPGRVVNYIKSSSPSSVARDVKGIAKSTLDAAVENPNAFIEDAIASIPAGIRDFGDVRETARKLRAQGRKDEAEAMEAMAGTAVLSALPIIGRPAGVAVRNAIKAAEKTAIKGAKKGATKVSEMAVIPEGKPSRAIQRFAAARSGPSANQKPLAQTRTPLPETAPSLPASVAGSFNAEENVPLTFKGLQPWELTSSQMADLGDTLGVENLGPLNEPVSFPYEMGGGERFEIPGGLEGKFTYEDMAKMKASGIDPSKIDPELHRGIQRKLMLSMDEPQGLSDAKVLSGLTFGYTSPNNPLTPNQLATSRLRMNSMEDLDRVINSRPWELTDAVTKEQREAFSDTLANRMGLGAASKGGIGARGSVDYSGYTDFLDLFRRDPAFFHRKEGEDWTGLVERMATQVPGLSNKTGSFGVAWQPEAGVSAIDRHMANRYMDTILADPAKREAFQKRALNLAAMRAAKEGKEAPTSFEDLNKGLIQELLLSEVGNSPSPKFRVKSGDVNPAVPEYLADVDWISEPQKAELMGQTYKDVVGANEAAMTGSGLHLFGNQWNIWDRIRQRLEPHENMFPGLEKIPRLSVEQMRAVDAAHGLTGHKNYSKDSEFRLQPTKAGDYKRFRYFSRGGLAVKKHNEDFAVRA